ncbi:MFS transporter [Nannocystis sp. ILAH1]|uniref:MFS transporter n=1 Tax=unclassified Nannocystis TaxID=2627009 RepID=UPI00226D4366|nr:MULTISPECIES: MFS transporter [unclassified Nannocystis]MCY0988757.1 MFS transporter [Nannocystis sp. ILAH1]MCY1072533.1 MFS transporter [Nannocystis sp. RBIL2]
MQDLSPSSTATRPADLPGPLLGLLATSTGLAAASIYYAQPLLALLAESLRVTPSSVGLVPTLTQLGYALGILLLTPLGDRYDRRRVIVVKVLLLAAALVASSLAPSLPLLLLASLAVGVVATAAQDIVPAVATLAPDARRGRAVGSVMTGLLLGILLSRVVSGAVAEQLGWRMMFALAAGAVSLIAVALRWRLPRFAPTTDLPYFALLRSLRTLWRRHPALRRAALAQGLLSVAFSAFWSTLAVWLHAAPFHLGSTAAGAFGLAGAAGALAAPLAGRLSDRRGPHGVTRLGAALVLASFLALLALPLLDRTAGLWLVALAAVGFDLGVQASLIAHQTIVYGLDPAARSRLNASFFTVVFIGMATGSALGGLLLEHHGVTGVFGLAALAAASALALRLVL